MASSSTGTEALSGETGELALSVLPTSEAVSLTSGTVTDILGFTLQAGDWDVCGSLETSGTATQITDLDVWVSPYSATRPTPDQAATFAVSSFSFTASGNTGLNAGSQLMTGPARLLIDAATPVYLTVVVSWIKGGTVLASGALRARRMR